MVIKTPIRLAQLMMDDVTFHDRSVVNVLYNNDSNKRSIYLLFSRRVFPAYNDVTSVHLALVHFGWSNCTKPNKYASLL